MQIFSRLFRYGTFGLAIAGVVLIGSVISEIHGQERKIPTPPVSPPGKPYDNTVAATGIVEASRENVSIGTPVAGLITEVLVQVGQKVKANGPLMRMDDRDLQAQLLKLNAQVELAKAKIAVQKAMVSKAQDMLERVKAVAEKAVSVDEVQQRENDFKVSKAQLAAAEAEFAAASADVKQTELLIDRLVVRAPRDGTILQVNIRAGEYAAISPKSPPLVLGDLSELQVRADVDEQNAVRIRNGQPGTAYIKGDAKRAFALKFVRVEPYVIPKVSLTGASTERVDTRVLQIIYGLERRADDPPVYVGQQVDVFIDAGSGTPRP